MRACGGGATGRERRRARQRLRPPWRGRRLRPLRLRVRDVLPSEVAAGGLLDLDGRPCRVARGTETPKRSSARPRTWGASPEVRHRNGALGGSPGCSASGAGRWSPAAARRSPAARAAAPAARAPGRRPPPSPQRPPRQPPRARRSAGAGWLSLFPDGGGPGGGAGGGGWPALKAFRTEDGPGLAQPAEAGAGPDRRAAAVQAVRRVQWLQWANGCPTPPPGTPAAPHGRPCRLPPPPPWSRGRARTLPPLRPEAAPLVAAGPRRIPGGDWAAGRGSDGC